MEEGGGGGGGRKGKVEHHITKGNDSPLPLCLSSLPSLPSLPSRPLPFPLTSKVETSQCLQCESDVANVRVGEEGGGGRSVEESGGLGGSRVTHWLVQQDQI